MAKNDSNKILKERKQAEALYNKQQAARIARSSGLGRNFNESLEGEDKKKEKENLTPEQQNRKRRSNRKNFAGLQNSLEELGAGDETVNNKKQAQALLEKLKAEAPQDRPKTYMILMAMALFKDFSDIASAQVFSLLDWLVDGMIGIIFSYFFGEKENGK